MDLTTTYLGLKLRNPLVPSASPLSEDLDNIKRMEDAGAGAVVLHSLFEEQLEAEEHELDRHLTQGSESFAEALSYFPELSSFRLGPEDYLEHITKAKAAVKIPVIASLNGTSTGGWIDYASRMQQAGADAIELN
ncbi:MAG: dihydroorotate dehydrogenase-like protein, partial [Candidatus Omnitrophica bacterium]|nr:dihydroorotate dehydrogenase-like protein [Candidatus Omnitrophota bacterium]